MKKVITIILVMFVFSAYADGDKVTTTIEAINSTINLAPVVPQEATFDDDLTFDLYKLRPIPPKEANFEEDTISKQK